MSILIELLKIDIFISLFNFVISLIKIMLIGDKVDKEYHYFYREIKRQTNNNVDYDKPVKLTQYKYNREKHENGFNVSKLHFHINNISNESNILYKKQFRKNNK